jgi:hypothetical protein
LETEGITLDLLWRMLEFSLSEFLLPLEWASPAESSGWLKVLSELVLIMFSLSSMIEQDSLGYSETLFILITYTRFEFGPSLLAVSGCWMILDGYELIVSLMLNEALLFIISTLFLWSKFIESSTIGCCLVCELGVLFEKLPLTIC